MRRSFTTARGSFWLIRDPGFRSDLHPGLRNLENQSSKLAAQKGNENVRAFAQQMITDHTRPATN